MGSSQKEASGAGYGGGTAEISDFELSENNFGLTDCQRRIIEEKAMILGNGRNLKMGYGGGAEAHFDCLI